jgi:hypothetical protein
MRGDVFIVLVAIHASRSACRYRTHRFEKAIKCGPMRRARQFSRVRGATCRNTAASAWVSSFDASCFSILRKHSHEIDTRKSPSQPKPPMAYIWPLGRLADGFQTSHQNQPPAFALSLCLLLKELDFRPLVAGVTWAEVLLQILISFLILLRLQHCNTD